MQNSAQQPKRVYKTDCLLTRVRFVGCTVDQHKRIGVNAQINARGGELWRNQPSTNLNIDMMNLWRVRNARVRVYDWRSKWFRRKFSHVLADRNDF